MSIVTKTGDTGETSLFGGKRVKKSDPLIEIIGAVDELNSFIGLVLIKVIDHEKDFLILIQKDLYQMMAFFSGAKVDLLFLKERVKTIEEKIFNLEKKLPPLNKFIIPTGTELSSWFHILRVICRRTERKVVSLENKKYLLIISYLNRLSDLFFTLARKYNLEKEILLSNR
jgi:cob(I)alamin adenosyltransferase